MTVETPFEKRNCYDCANLKSAVSWWCTDENAIKARGTSIPGCNHCPYWKPDWDYIDAEFKTEQFGYISKKKKNQSFFIRFLKFF